MDRTEPAVHRPALVLGVLSASILLDALDLSITQVALPSIQRDLALPAAALQWVATGYALTYGGFLLLGGRAADLYGRRRVFLGGLVLFGVMSLAAGLAPNAAAAGGRPLRAGHRRRADRAGRGVDHRDDVSPRAQQRNRALGVFAASASAGFSVGLVLGGVLTDLLGWRWIFLVKAPIVAVVLLVAVRSLPGDAPADDGRRPIDVAGAVTGTAGVLLLVLAVSQAAEPTVGTWLPVAARRGRGGSPRRVRGRGAPRGGPADPARAVPQSHACAPPTSPRSPCWPPRSASPSSPRCTCRTSWAGGRSAPGWRCCRAPCCRSSCRGGSPPAWWTGSGLRTAGVTGLLLVAAGFALLLRLDPDTGYATGLLPAVVVCFGLGMGIAYPVFTIAAVSGVDAAEQGVAAGVQSTALQVGGGLGLALVSGAVALGLGVGAAQPTMDALHLGAAVGTALPLLGAAVAVFGLGGRGRRPGVTTRARWSHGAGDRAGRSRTRPPARPRRLPT